MCQFIKIESDKVGKVGTPPKVQNTRYPIIIHTKSSNKIFNILFPLWKKYYIFTGPTFVDTYQTYQTYLLVSKCRGICELVCYSL